MRTLFIDIASHEGLLACVTDTEVVAFREVHNRIGDDELLPLLEECLKKAGWSLDPSESAEAGRARDDTLTHLACVIGPGGFTSLRIAVSLINTMSWALDIPSCGIHLSDVYAKRAGSEKQEARDHAWLHSTKKNELFIRGFGDLEKIWPEPTHITLEEALQKIPEGTLWCGELIPEHQEAFAHLSPIIYHLSPTHILPQFLGFQSYKAQILEPWYGRGW